MSNTQTPVNPTDENECVWTIGTPCDGEVTWQEFFFHQIRIPVCKQHLREHWEIMVLYKNQYDVEEVLNQTPEWRKQEVLTIELSGLIDGEVEL